MPVRRFVAYFFAISAGSTVVFASTLMGPPAPPDTPAPADAPALAASLPPPAPRLRSYRRPVKIAQVALLK